MNIRLMEPWLLLLALVVVPIVVWSMRSRAPREGRVRFSTVGVLAQLPATRRMAWRPVVDVLRLAALLLVVVALARPAITRTAEVLDRIGLYRDDRAAALARRMLAFADPASRIVAGYRIALQRDPSAAEADRAGRFLAGYPGDDAERFTLNATTGVLAFATAPDFENPTDTATCPWDVGTHASRGAFIACNAAIRAANKARAKLSENGVDVAVVRKQK